MSRCVQCADFLRERSVAMTQKRALYAAALAMPIAGFGLMQLTTGSRASTSDTLRANCKDDAALSQQQLRVLIEGNKPENRAATLDRALSHVGPWAKNQRASDNAVPAKTFDR